MKLNEINDCTYFRGYKMLDKHIFGTTGIPVLNMLNVIQLQILGAYVCCVALAFMPICTSYGSGGRDIHSSTCTTPTLP